MERKQEEITPTSFATEAPEENQTEGKEDDLESGHNKESWESLRKQLDEIMEIHNKAVSYTPDLNPIPVEAEWIPLETIKSVEQMCKDYHIVPDKTVVLIYVHCRNGTDRIEAATVSVKGKDHWIPAAFKCENVEHSPITRITHFMPKPKMIKYFEDNEYVLKDGWDDNEDYFGYGRPYEKANVKSTDDTLLRYLKKREHCLVFDFDWLFANGWLEFRREKDKVRTNELFREYAYKCLKEEIPGLKERAEFLEDEDRPDSDSEEYLEYVPSIDSITYRFYDNLIQLTSLMPKLEELEETKKVLMHWVDKMYELNKDIRKLKGIEKWYE